MCICHACTSSSHNVATQLGHSVDRAGWQAKMASIEFWIIFQADSLTVLTFHEGSFLRSDSSPRRWWSKFTTTT